MIPMQLKCLKVTFLVFSLLNKSEALLQKAVNDVKANKIKPERNINDLAGQLSDELAAKGISYNPDTMWEFVNKKFRQQKINKEEFL